VDGRLSAEQARLAALQSLFRTLLYELMSGRLRIPAGRLAEFSEQFKT
jgi:hypothetical protein